MTPAMSSLETKRFLRRWWWFDPAQVSEKCEASLAWETVRRTRSYSALWRKFSKETVPLLQHPGTPTLAGAFQHSHLFQRSREALGQPYFDFMMKGFDPALTWLELEQWQRLTARGFLIGEGVALKVNQEYVLPRQVAEKPCVSVGIVRLARNDSGHLRLIRDRPTAQAVGNVENTDFFRDLPFDAPGQCVCVIFDTRGGRDALLDSFDAAMRQWLGPPPVPGEKMDADYWAGVSKENERLAVRWNPEDGAAVEFWTPEIHESNVRVKASEQALIPSDDPPLAIFMVSARHNPATVRAAFHTQLKSFKKWHPQCVAFWKTLTVTYPQLPKNQDGTDRLEVDESGKIIYEQVTRNVFDPRNDLPSPVKPKRSARRKNPWLGLAANDVVTTGLPLGKRTAEGAFLLDHTTSCDALHNAQRSAETWLKELDETAGRLDKNLAHWNDQSAELASIGFFQAAAGEPPRGPE